MHLHEIERLAREHGTGGWQTLDDMVRFGQAIAKAEQERCALVAEGFAQTRDWVPGSLYDTLRREVAARIRRA